MKISILMPIYNGIEYLQDSLESVLAQTYTNWELIIGINGHEPNSEIYETAAKICAKSASEGKIFVYDLQGVKGKSAALNNMMKYVSGQYIALLDVDDIWLPEKLENQLLCCSLDYDVIGTGCEYFGEMNGRPNIPYGDIHMTTDFTKVNPVINSSVLIKRKLAYWEEHMNMLEDYDLWLRLWIKGAKFFNINKCLIKHRIHKTSAFNSKKTTHRILHENLTKIRENPHIPLILIE